MLLVVAGANARRTAEGGRPHIRSSGRDSSASPRSDKTKIPKAKSQELKAYFVVQHSPLSNLSNCFSKFHSALARSLEERNLSQVAPSLTQAAARLLGADQRLAPGRKLYSMLLRTICFNCG